MVTIVHLPTEILHVIAVELSLDCEHDPDHSFGNYRKRNKVRRRHLARLAGTCRRFYDIVNPILWRRHWKEALLSSAEHGRHAIIDFLADNQAKLCLKGLGAGANCFDYKFAETERWDTFYDNYPHDEMFVIYEDHCLYEVPLYPAIVVPAMDTTLNKDPAATVMYMITKGQASPYGISRDPCWCYRQPDNDPHIPFWRPIFHTLLCGSTVYLKRYCSPGKYGIVHRMLCDIKDFDLRQAYGDDDLLSWLICRSSPHNGAPEHLPDIVNLLITMYGLDLNQGSSLVRGGFGLVSGIRGVSYPERMPLHDAIRTLANVDKRDLDRIPHDYGYDYILDTICRLFRHGADPSLVCLVCGYHIRRYIRGSYEAWPVTAMGMFLYVWWKRRIHTPRYIRRHWNDSWDWRPLAGILISNGARCHFDGNWECPGPFDFEFFMAALEGSCETRDVDMLRLVVDNLAPSLHQEGLFTPKLWEMLEPVPDKLAGFSDTWEGESARAEWWTARRVDSNWATHLAKCSRLWEKWHVPVQSVGTESNSCMRTEEWAEGLSLLAKLPFSADDAQPQNGSQ
ncbi:hypothetical protein SMACR_05657 [Sordaria macrospora]|uniref:WGS project CABT00000000 data, contig 2.30 n=2 Tax=Sordaria macrospora TaxID=5147 RepID=F7W5A9_SORMK|nr:uncharacterized protein SMAC_05657 [Sordaria macrospora k-hell]KAA8629144.1 hypothetical protein SMACR_05657 [Sordaria macrospora]KAH7628094.1 hypothetical protein B0T09DRAFT_175238 [Sordaria sp. MPI-SDFR-AT-0083]WPJ65538.1 hypothetical protein SMAC4_05657 [Sordaria macrospora]CCC12697.1 unnamed protein product [Sordaria macrospora k-hell]